MYFAHTFPIGLENGVYYLSPDAFSYIISTYFLHAEHEDPDDDVLRNSCPLTLTAETVVKILEKIPLKSPRLQLY